MTGRARRGRGPRLVRALVLLHPRRLLRHPAAPRRDGRVDGRRLRPELALLRDARRHARRQSAVRRPRPTHAPARVRPGGHARVRRELRGVLRAPHVSRRARAPRRGAVLLRVRERLQPPRRVGLLGLPRRPLPLRAGQAPLRVHRPRRHGGRHPGRRRHRRARAAHRPGAAPARRGGPLRGRRPLPAPARGDLPRGRGRRRAGGRATATASRPARALSRA